MLFLLFNIYIVLSFEFTCWTTQFIFNTFLLISVHLHSLPSFELMPQTLHMLCILMNLMNLRSPPSWCYACWAWRENSRYQPPSLLPVQGKQNKHPTITAGVNPTSALSHSVWTNKQKQCFYHLSVVATLAMVQPWRHHEPYWRQHFIRTDTRQLALEETHCQWNRNKGIVNELLPAHSTFQAGQAVPGRHTCPPTSQ